LIVERGKNRVNRIERGDGIERGCLWVRRQDCQERVLPLALGSEKKEETPKSDERRGKKLVKLDGAPRMGHERDTGSIVRGALSLTDFYFPGSAGPERKNRTI